MRISIELDTEHGPDLVFVKALNDAMTALVGGAVVVHTTEHTARDTARELHKAKAETPPTPPHDPDDRIYGEKGEKSRRTKDEIAEDEAIAERWSALWPSKDVPAKPVGELKAHLDKIESEQDLKVDEEDEFDVGGDEADEILDLEEFRGIIVKHSKTLGKKLGEIMAPYKNPGQVPEAERRDFADKIIEAAGAE